MVFLFVTEITFHTTLVVSFKIIIKRKKERLCYFEL
jgi:hypothetical protein